MVLARGRLFREGAGARTGSARTQQASQNATRGHHTQTQDPSGGHILRGCGSVREPRVGVAAVRASGD